MNIRLAIVISGFAGYLALSYEILWFRIYGYLTGGAPSSFGVVLGVYLLGIALGSLSVRRFCDDGAAGDPKRLVLAAWLVLFATLGGYALLPAVADVVRTRSYCWTLPGVAVVAGMMGAVLPLVAHFGIRADERAGERLSWIYLSNILGSTLGSLVTGFVLMQWLSTARIAMVLALGGFALTGLLIVSTKPSRAALARWSAVLVASGVGTTLLAPFAYEFLYEKLLFKGKWIDQTHFARVLENRSGIIAVSNDRRIFGGGMYDGYFSTSLVRDRNAIVRAYAISAMRETLPEVMLVGLASGSWTQVVVSNPGVGHLTVVEINAGYSQIISEVPEVASVLRNPRITIVHDDARRWLTAHPDRKFDLIVQNTTWHWRGHMTNILSAEYHELVKRHLNPSGVFYINTTSSLAAMKTACVRYKHGFRYLNFIAVSDAPLTLDAERWRRRLTEYRINDVPLFDLRKPTELSTLEAVLATSHLAETGGKEDPAEPCVRVLERARDEPVVTDDNMVTEWRRPWYAQPAAGE